MLLTQGLQSFQMDLVLLSSANTTEETCYHELSTLLEKWVAHPWNPSFPWAVQWRCYSSSYVGGFRHQKNCTSALLANHTPSLTRPWKSHSWPMFACLDCENCQWRHYMGRDCAYEERSSPSSANQGLHKAKNRHGHAACNLWVHPPTSSHPFCLCKTHLLRTLMEETSWRWKSCTADMHCLDIENSTSHWLFMYIFHFWTWWSWFVMMNCDTLAHCISLKCMH